MAHQYNSHVLYRNEPSDASPAPRTAPAAMPVFQPPTAPVMPPTTSAPTSRLKCLPTPHPLGVGIDANRRSSFGAASFGNSGLVVYARCPFRQASRPSSIGVAVLVRLCYARSIILVELVLHTCVFLLPVFVRTLGDADCRLHNFLIDRVQARRSIEHGTETCAEVVRVRRVFNGRLHAIGELRRFGGEHVLLLPDSAHRRRRCALQSGCLCRRAQSCGLQPSQRCSTTRRGLHPWRLRAASPRRDRVGSRRYFVTAPLVWPARTENGRACDCAQHRPSHVGCGDVPRRALADWRWHYRLHARQPFRPAEDQTLRCPCKRSRAPTE